MYIVGTRHDQVRGARRRGGPHLYVISISAVVRDAAERRVELLGALTSHPSPESSEQACKKRSGVTLRRRTIDASGRFTSAPASKSTSHAEP